MNTRFSRTLTTIFGSILLISILYSVVNRFALNFQTNTETDFVKPDKMYRGGVWYTSVEPSKDSIKPVDHHFID